jgi:hypothetical protein
MVSVFPLTKKVAVEKCWNEAQDFQHKQLQPNAKPTELKAVFSGP